ncbi:hypothetical protein DM02DRAFT_619905, partial [Periconia macrospinosa]
QAVIWDSIISSEFPSERYFTSLHTLEESGRTIQGRMMGSKLDLNHFQRFTIKDRVSLIVKQLYNKPALRRKFKLRGSVKFKNHANTLSPKLQLEDGIEQITVSRPRQRQSPRLQAQTKEKEARLSSAARMIRSSRTQSSENSVAAFIIKYKAPHKLPLGYIYKVRALDADTLRGQYRRLIAAVITQAFSYMIEGGLEYGTVQYYLSVPKGDALKRPQPHTIPQDNTLSFLRMSPIQLRQRAAATGLQNCWQLADEHRASASLKSTSRRRRQSGQYYTQKCLLRLVNRGTLNALCPNQLSRDLDTDCKPIGRPRACSVLFQVKLKSHSYTVAAKATPIHFLRPTHYFYKGITKLRISRHLTAHNGTVVAQQPRNILWNKERHQVIIIDFERAEIVKPRSRKRTLETSMTKRGENGTVLRALT